MDNQSIQAHSLELHLPYCVCSKIPQKNYVWRNKEGTGGDFKEIMRDETGTVNRWKSVRRPCPYVCSNTTQDVCFGIHVVFEGKGTLMLFGRHPEYRTKYGERHFWARGYYVSTVGNVNEETV